MNIVAVSQWTYGVLFIQFPVNFDESKQTQQSDSCDRSKSNHKLTVVPQITTDQLS